MKLKKALRGYYREQVDAVEIAGGPARIKTGHGGNRLWVFNVAFHAVIIGFIVSAMISGYYQPSPLEERMYVIADRYNVQERLKDSLENIILIIQKNRNDGGKL